MRAGEAALRLFCQGLNATCDTIHPLWPAHPLLPSLLKGGINFCNCTEGPVSPSIESGFWVLILPSFPLLLFNLLWFLCRLEGNRNKSFKTGGGTPRKKVPNHSRSVNLLGSKFSWTQWDIRVSRNRFRLYGSSLSKFRWNLYDWRIGTNVQQDCRVYLCVRVGEFPLFP